MADLRALNAPWGDSKPREGLPTSDLPPGPASNNQTRPRGARTFPLMFQAPEEMVFLEEPGPELRPCTDAHLGNVHVQVTEAERRGWAARRERNPIGRASAPHPIPLPHPQAPSLWESQLSKQASEPRGRDGGRKPERPRRCQQDSRTILRGARQQHLVARRGTTAGAGGLQDPPGISAASGRLINAVWLATGSALRRFASVVAARKNTSPHGEHVI